MRILSLDGGGTWSLLQVRALMEIYGANATGYDVLKEFDVVAGTSGGSIVAGALASGKSLNEILDFFLSQQNRQTIFAPLTGIPAIVGDLVSFEPHYDTGNKFIGLTNILGTTLAQTSMDALNALLADPSRVGHPVDYIITSFDYDRGRAIIFRSNRGSMAAPITALPTTSIIGAIQCSSTAPIKYFNHPATIPDPGFSPPAGPPYRFWDGAVTGMNNPVLLAVVDALSNGNLAANINVLSLGTGTVRLPVVSEAPVSPLYQQAASPGLLNDLGVAADATCDDPPDEASLFAYIALGLPLPRPGDALPLGTGRFVRLSPLVQPVTDANGNLAPPVYNLAGQNDYAVFGALATLHIDAITDEQVRYITALGDAWIAGSAYNQPIRSDINLACEVGHQKFADGKNAWLAANQA